MTRALFNRLWFYESKKKKTQEIINAAEYAVCAQFMLRILVHEEWSNLYFIRSSALTLLQFKYDSVQLFSFSGINLPE